MTSKAFGLAQLGNAYADGALSNRNKIINGAMVIDQRNAGASVTQNTSGIYTLDRWQAYGAAASKFTVQQNAGSVTPPNGFTNYLGCTSSSAYTVGASEGFTVSQIVEGFNIADLNWGTASAQPVTISFWVRSSLTGTFGGALQNIAQNRNYPFSYTIVAANTWEKKAVTIPGDTTGTWATDNTSGIRVYFSLGAGSSWSAAAGAWTSSFALSATGAVSVVGTNGATFYITGVQLEAGDTATPFEHRSYGQELALCQRYFCTSGGPVLPQQTSYLAALFRKGIGAVYTDSYAYSNNISFPCEMRTAPSVTIVSSSLSSADNQAAVYSRNGGWNTCVGTFSTPGPLGMMFDLYDNSGIFVGRDSCLYYVGWYANAEL